MTTKRIVFLMLSTAVLWIYPFFDSIKNHAQSIDDLNMVAKIMVWAGMLLLFVLMFPLFLWIVNKIKSAYLWLANWLSGQ